MKILPEYSNLNRLNLPSTKLRLNSCLERAQLILFADQDIGDAGLADLAPALFKLKNLENLDLKSNHITCEGAIILTHELKQSLHVVKIKSLSLAGMFAITAV